VTAFSGSDRLTPIQREFLQAFAARTSAYFLTGGAVLAGWVLGHRRTDDLDLFTTDDAAMAESDRLVRGVADQIAATVDVVRSTPDFRRYLLRRGSDGVVVDLARERVAQLRAKVVRDGLPMDPVEEIVANKICALLGRAEIRDLVDLYCLERAGFPVERFLEDAQQKDAGVTPATLAWVLSEVVVPDALPGDVDAVALRAFTADLEMRLRRMALPSGS
jgi:predicted nucleotidyltransferase component of viral defense system